MDVMSVLHELIAPLVSIFFILLKEWNEYRRSKREEGTEYRLSLRNWWLCFAAVALILMFSSVIGFFAKEYEKSRVKGCLKVVLMSESGPQLKTKQEIMAKMSELGFDYKNVIGVMVEMIQRGELKIDDCPVYCDKLKKESHIDFYFLSSSVTGMPK